MRYPLSRLSFVVLLLLLAGGTAFAQTFTGAVRGAVRDANGVIPGVTVELINEATNLGREAVSNEVGLYNFAAVPPGTYTVKASLTGFKTYEQKGIRVGAQQFVTLDVALEVGTLQETITVTGRSAAHRHLHRVDRRGHQHRAARGVAERRPFGVPVRGHGADRGGVG